MILERVAGSRRERLPRVVQHALTLVLVLVAWVFFRATSVTHAFDMLAAMFGLAGDPTAEPLHGDLVPRFALFALILGGAISLAPIAWKHRERAVAWLARFEASSIAPRIAYLLLFALSAIHLTNIRFTPLIYFKF